MARDFQEITIKTEAGKEVKRTAYGFMHGTELFAQIGRVLYKKMKGEGNVYEFIGYSGEVKI